MKLQKFAATSGIALAVFSLLVALALSFSGASPSARAHKAEAPNAVAWDTDGNSVTNANFLGTTNKKPLVFKTMNQERMRILKNGNVGIGTNNPVTRLDVQGSISSFNGVAMRLLNSNDSNTNQWVLGTGGGVVAKDAFSIGDNSAYRLTMLGNGNVGIGTTNPDALVDVRGSGSNLLLRARNSAGQNALEVYEDRHVTIGAFYIQSSAGHLCYFHISNRALTDCSSAAEYVPTVGDGSIFPETADLVSIALNVKNPYGDTHAPFAVQKAALPCDSNLLGFIVNPELGADGKKLNDHYLPLAIYGYFPAKVTMESGPIKRGDPITSSSKAGYGMKATGACKVIGYALEDANEEGTIQIFASQGENTAPEVVELRAQVQELRVQNAALEARLDALEHALQIQTRPVDTRRAAPVASR